MPVIGCHIANHIQADGKLNVARIEIHQMIRPFRRDVIQQFLGQVAVRVYDADAVAEHDVLHDEISQQRRFAGTSLADDVDMLTLIHGGNAKGLGIAPALPISDRDVWCFVIHDAETNRHPCHRKIRAVVDVAGSLTPAVVRRARKRDNGGWFRNPNSRHHISRAKIGRAVRRGCFPKWPSQAVLFPWAAQNTVT